MRRKGQSQVSGRITASGRAPLMIGDVQLGGSHPRIVVYLLRNKACAQLLTHLALSERFRVHVGCDSLEDGTPIRARNPRNPPPVVDAWEVCGTPLALRALVESNSCYRTDPGRTGVGTRTTIPRSSAHEARVQDRGRQHRGRSGRGDGAYSLLDVSGSPEEVGKAIAESLKGCDIVQGKALLLGERGQDLYLNLRIRISPEHVPLTVYDAFRDVFGGVHHIQDDELLRGIPLDSVVGRDAQKGLVAAQVLMPQLDSHPSVKYHVAQALIAHIRILADG